MHKTFLAHERTLYNALLATLVITLSTSLTFGQASGHESFRNQKNDRGNRYEGIVEVPNGKRDYELLAFFAYKNVNPISSEGKLHLRFYVPPGDDVQSVLVKEIHSDTQYQAEFKVAQIQPLPDKNWKDVGDWPVADVIKPSHVAPSNLGVLIHLNDSKEPGQVAPAILYTSEKPSKVQEYRLYFVSHKPLRNLNCSVLQGSAKAGTCDINGTAGGAVEASEPATITFNAASLAPGEVAIQLQGSVANTASNNNFSLNLHFFHQAQMP